MRISFYRHHKWFQNYKVKLFSFLSAIFLWVFVVTDNRFDHTMSIPLRLTNKPKGWILTQPIPSEVRVRFRGSGKDLLSFHFRDKRIELDLYGIRKSARLSLAVDMIKGIPVGMDIIPFRIFGPDSVTIQLDRFGEKNVPVRPDLTFVPLDGYTHVGDVILEPDSVVVLGPESLVNRIAEVSTEKKEYTNLLKEIRGKVSLVPPSWETLQYSLNSVRFRVDVQRIGERMISEIPITVTRIPRGVKVTVVPSTLSLKLQGGVNVLSKLKKEEVIAAIDFRSRYRYRGKRIPATIHLSRGISFSDVKPQFFELIVER